MTTTIDSLSTTRVRVDELNGVVENQKEKKEEYAAILSQQSNALTDFEAKHHQNVERKEEIEEAIAWYNKVLGFRIECGHGVKFIFMNINPTNPSEEYSITIRLENDTYTMLDCDPVPNGTNELMKELNLSNGLFKFVRTMRQKFQEATTTGNFPRVPIYGQDLAMISVSAPASSVSTDSTIDSPSEHNKLQPVDLNRISQKVNPGK